MVLNVYGDILFSVLIRTQNREAFKSTGARRKKNKTLKSSSGRCLAEGNIYRLKNRTVGPVKKGSSRPFRFTDALSGREEKATTHFLDHLLPITEPRDTFSPKVYFEET